MEIVVAPPPQVLWFVIGLPVVIAVVVLSAGAVKRTPWPHLLAPIVLSVGASAAVYHWALRPMVFAWNEQGLRDQTFGAELQVPWADVSSARLVRHYLSTDYRPTRRTHGTAYGSYRSGWFTLANGTNARVFLMLDDSPDALLLNAGETTYLYAPRSFDSFLEAVRQHVVISE